MAEVRNAQVEAAARLGGAMRARVLEPSPPAVDDGDFCADDPTTADVPGDGPLVSPSGNGDRTWADAVADDASLVDWTAARSLAAHRRLGPPPPTLIATRVALHRLATYVVAPARHQATGKFGLRWVKGGFGTPFYGNDVQVRVEGTELVVQAGDTVRSAPITTLRAAAELIGSEIDPEIAAEHDSPPLGDVDEALAVDGAAVACLDTWWGLGTFVLENIRADAESVEPSRVQMWPGHFDPAIEVGDDDHRGSFGASPGDQTSPEPYLYVSVWWPDKIGLDRDDPYWNADGYVGATLPLARLAEAEDQATAALEFFRTGRSKLT